MNYKGLRIGELCSKRFNNVEHISFLSDESIFDYDLLFCDLNILDNHFPAVTYTPKDHNNFRSFFSFFDKRKADINEFNKNGKKIIFLMPYPESYFYNGGSSGRGEIRNKVDLLPFKIDVEKKRGDRIQVVPQTLFSNLFNKYFDYFHYRAISRSGPGIPLCTIENTSILVSSKATENIFLFPYISNLDTDIENQFIIDVIDVLFPEKLVVLNALPAWTESYCLPNELNRKAQIELLIEQKNELVKAIDLETKSYSEIISNKVLFSGTGDDLENQIEKIFTELEFTILPKKNGRDDIILEYNSKVAVVEIKGVKGSAAEKQAAQLNKWVANYYADFEIEPKGILIINAYKDEELINRKFEEIFPNQMLDFCTRMKFCLITTTQLLGLYFDIKNNPDKKNALIDTLFSTIGIYENYKNWSDYIEVIK
jgi:hypothetical protein